jgi:hypothetical protein
MFKFLKSMFKEQKKAIKSALDEKKEPEAVKIKASELTKWFSERVKEKGNIFMDEVEPYLDEIRSGKHAISEALNKLEKAGLRNKNIPPRAITIMEGNRSHYIQNMRRFIECLAIPDKIEDILSFHEEFTVRVNTLTKTTTKSFFVLQEFFSHESGDVARLLKKMNDAVGKIAESSHNLKGILDIKDHIKYMDSAAEMCANIDQQITATENSLKETDESSTKFQKEMEKLKKSPQYKEYELLNTQREELHKKLKDKEDLLRHEFSVIEHALKKFERLAADQELVRDYLDDPVSTLQEDNDVKIVGILAKMKEALQNNELDLKDEKKEKTLETLGKLNKEFFVGFMLSYSELKKSRHDMERKVQQNIIMSTMRDYEYRLQHFKEKSSRLSQELEELKKLKGKGYDDAKKKLQKKLSDLFESKIAII